MTTERQRPIDPDLFDWPAAEPALKGSLCGDCGEVAFPAARSCSNCGGENVSGVELPRRGTLWTWTVQRFMPKPPYASDETPETFRPFGIGYVELPGALKVEARLTESDPERLAIGAEMALTFYTHRTEPDGTEIINFAFTPVGESR